MHFPWAVLIAMAVLGLALLIKHFCYWTIEDEKIYLYIILAFFAVYIGAAFAVSALNPKIIVRDDQVYTMTDLTNTIANIEPLPLPL